MCLRGKPHIVGLMTVMLRMSRRAHISGGVMQENYKSHLVAKCTKLVDILHAVAMDNNAPRRVVQATATGWRRQRKDGRNETN